jgi:hypothetical protein
MSSTLILTIELAAPAGTTLATPLRPHGERLPQPRADGDREALRIRPRRPRHRADSPGQPAPDPGARRNRHRQGPTTATDDVPASWKRSASELSTAEITNMRPGIENRFISGVLGMPT